MSVHTLHRGGFAETFDEIRTPTKSFPPARSAGHIDLPLDGARAEPVYGMPGVKRGPPMPRVRPIAFIDKATCDAAHERRSANAERQRIALASAHASGFDRGLVAGYWRGARHFGLVGVLAGAAIAVGIVRLGALA